jgi:CDP-diacylglycerol--glycerol-3-phosphate 3-phosphatidyltransferase
MVRDSFRPSKSVNEDAFTLSLLRRKLFALAGLFGLLTLIGGWLLSRLWEPAYALRWIVLSMIILAYQTILLSRVLPKNHRPDNDSLVPHFGIGNLLTMVRGVCLCWLAGFLFAPRPPGLLAWLPAAVYLTADILDYFDGLMARITGLSTELGSYWDQELDSIGVVIAPLLGVLYGQLPIWVLLVSASRYLFILGIWWRKTLNKPVFDLPPSVYRRAFAGFQMGVFGFTLLPIFSPPATWVSVTVFMIPFTLGFLRDWLVVSGVFDATQKSYQSMVQSVTSLGMRILPVILRALVVLISVRFGLAHSAGLPMGLMPDRAIPLMILGFLEIALALLVGSGIGGRITALALLLVIGFSLNGHQIAVIVLIASTSYMTVLGTGAFSIWQPEEEFVRRRYGGGVLADS